MLARTAFAEAPRLGAGPNLLPGYFRVPVVAAAELGARVGGGLGYGFTESQAAAPGSHHRVLGRVGAGITPLPWLGVGIGTNLRHDRHPDDALGADRGTVIDSDVQVLGGTALAGGWHLGAGLASQFARGDDLDTSFAHPAIDLTLLAAYVPLDAPFSIGLSTGYRVDRTGALLAHTDEFRDGDRLALGLSDFDALITGVGMSYRLAETELLAELSADVLLGAEAPALRHSPLRATFGARQHISDAVSLRLDADTSLSARARTEPGDPLYPVEPRFQVAIGMACRVLDWERPAAEPSVHPEPRLPVLERSPAPPSTLVVNVTTLDGHPLSDARVEASSAGVTRVVPHESLERYRLTGVRASEVVLQVSAERLASVTQTVQLEPGSSLVVEVRLAPEAPSGQIRGLIRSFDGQGLFASIRIEPLGKTLQTDRGGAFEVDVPPGHYEVVVEARGHGRQTRSIDVGSDGVVILNADLRRAP